MKLDQLTIEIRPRRPWEAVDLGFRMAQRWWWPLTLIFVVLTFPLWLGISFIDQKYWQWKLLAFWLFLPLFERPLLYFLSQAVFNDLLSVRQVLKISPSLIWPQLIASVTWRRFSPSRSMDMPITVLEGLKGKRRASRISVLHREDAGPATWMTLITFFCVPAIALTIFLVFIQLISQFFDTPWWEFTYDTSWLGFFSNWAGLIYYHLLYVGLVLVTPFYVAAGFALYLNRRISLEAWDVEIAFKKIVQKRLSIQHGLLVLLIGGMLFQFIPQNSFAKEEGNDALVLSEAQKQARTEIKAILEGDDFNQYEKKVRRRLPFDKDREIEKSENPLGFFSWLEKFIQNFALIGEVLLWVGVFCLIFYLVFRYRHWLADLMPESTEQRQQTPETLFGLKITEESLPDDIGESAKQLLKQGCTREALALLYRASLAQLVKRGLELRDGDTELECLRASRKHAKRLRITEKSQNYFDGLTRLWRNLAYGHLAPEKDFVLQLCDEWAPSWGALTRDGKAQVEPAFEKGRLE